MFSLGISKSPGTLIFGRAVWAQASWILWSEEADTGGKYKEKTKRNSSEDFERE